jgi:hypothetical protein
VPCAFQLTPTLAVIWRLMGASNTWSAIASQMRSAAPRFVGGGRPDHRELFAAHAADRHAGAEQRLQAGHTV